jgi:dihydrofolate synthase/folylpolyglutamate synthase
VTYKEALAYLYSFSNFERSGKYTRNPEENLPREARLLTLLGNPQEQYSTTLIAGTKGKGSTATYIERVLREAGIRTGLYTQPDLHTFRERMRVNEHRQEEHQFAPFITYEVATALAFLYFARQGVQHAVIEVGLGGRLDATNVLQPLVSVITSISYDHMQILGNTLTEIATEKAGIIKQNGVVVTSAQQPEALLAIVSVCQKRQAQLLRVGASDVVDAAQTEVDAGQVPPLSYRYHLEERYRDETRQRFTVWTPTEVYGNLEIPLAGQYQLENATTALATLELLREHGVMWDERALRLGLRKVHWPARIEVVGAHNADSMQKLLEALRASFSMRRLIMVLSIAQDKDIAGIVRELQDIDVVIVTHMHSSRAATISDLQKAFAEHAPHVEIHSATEIDAAMQLALTLAGKDDLICATGSLYLAAEVLRWAAAHGASNVATEIEGADHL